MSDTINNGIPFVPENTIDPAAGLNESLLIIDRLLQLKVLGMKVNTPAVGPVAGDRYIVGTSPTGAWVGEELQVAEWMPDGYWGFSPASVAVYATSVYINTGTDWVPATAGSPTSWGGITGAIADQADLASALGAKANTADLGAVATSNDYNDLDDLPTLGTAAATDAADYATAAQGDLADSAVQPDDLASVATSGAAADVVIDDSGSYYSSTDVEGALQEVGDEISGSADALDLVIAALEDILGAP